MPRQGEFHRGEIVHVGANDLCTSKKREEITEIIIVRASSFKRDSFDIFVSNTTATND